MSDPTQRPIGRRTFLGIAGAAGIAAGCSPRAATQKIVPWVVPPEEIVLLCEISVAVDYGTFEGAGLELAFRDRLGVPGSEGCVLELRKASRS
jgi:hypothetical protein